MVHLYYIHQLIYKTTMSKGKLINTISRELKDINEVIDWKIIKGLPYKREAKRHKLLLSMLGGATQSSDISIWRFTSFLF